MIIRKAAITDAEAFWQMQFDLDQETAYMMYEPNERIKDISRVESIINQSITGNNLLLLVEDNASIVGYISAQRGGLRRIMHTAYIVTGIRKEYQHRGIGTQLFNELDSWAKVNDIKRLELTVMSQNIPARYLYEKAGFTVEGTKKCSMFVNDEYKDEYYMAKIM